MKKVFFAMLIFMFALIVNGQQDTSKMTPRTKSGGAAMSSDKAVRTTVKVADLKKSITDNVAKDYAGYTIKEATSVSLDNVVTYEVVITKGTSSETLVYDKDGNFVQKLAAVEEMNQLRK